MNRKTILVPEGTFRSRLVPVAAVLFAAAAVCGIPAVGFLFHPSSVPAILHDMELGQIYDQNAQLTWLIIYIAVTLVNTIAAAILGSGMGQVLRGRKYEGMDLLYKAAGWMLKAVTVSGILAVPYFLYRFVSYAAMCIQYEGGLVPLYSMVLMEGLMGAQAYVLFSGLRRFLNCAMDASAGIGRTITSGELSAPTIPGFTATGFLILGIVDAGIAVDRFFTFYVVQMNMHITYHCPLTTDPVQFLSGLSFAFAALGSAALYLYLRGFKQKSEQLLLRTDGDINTISTMV